VHTPKQTSNIIQPPEEPFVVIPNIRASDISAAVDIAFKNINKREKVAESLFNKQIFAQ